MAYLDSNNVVVFPIAKERVTMPGTRLFTEQNVSNLIRQLLSNGSKGFIISSETIDGSWVIEFNLLGYYFKISGINESWIQSIATDEDISNDSITGVYACINIDDLTNEIIGQDTDGKYEGLNLLFIEPTSSDNYIKLLSYKNNTLSLPSMNIGFATALIGGIDGKYK